MKKLQETLRKNEAKRVQQQRFWIGWKPWHPWLVVLKIDDGRKRYRLARDLEEGREAVVDAMDDDPHVESGWVVALDASPEKRRPAQ